MPVSYKFHIKQDMDDERIQIECMWCYDWISVYDYDMNGVETACDILISAAVNSDLN